jgi:capsular polysaccharide biosynthesis protein
LRSWLAKLAELKSQRVAVRETEVEEKFKSLGLAMGIFIEDSELSDEVEAFKNAAAV